MKFRRSMVVLSLAGGLAMPAHAETVAAHWDGYFYAAPQAGARVLDEVQRETTLDVRNCESGWCRVRYGAAEGYVREEIVRGPVNAVHPDDRPLDANCFEAGQPGGNAWQSERFCRSRASR